MFKSDVDVNRMSLYENLYTALMNEKKASENYKAIARIFKKANSVMAEKIFLEMSKVEQGHYNKLAKALDSCKAERTITSHDPVWQSPETLPGSDDYMTLVAIRPEMSVEEAVKILEDAEKDSETFYLSTAEQVDRVDLKELFKELASEEAKHHRLVKKIVRHALER